MNKKKYFYLIGNLMFYFILINSQTIKVPGCIGNWKDPKTNNEYNIVNLQNNIQDYVIEVPNAPTPYKITLNICRNIINNACSSQSGSDVAACQQWPLSNPQWSNSLGKASEIMFNSSSSSNSNFQVTFGGTTSTLSILFTCNESAGVGIPKFLSETTNMFQVSWESQYACPKSYYWKVNEYFGLPLCIGKPNFINASLDSTCSNKCYAVQDYKYVSSHSSCFSKPSDWKLPSGYFSINYFNESKCLTLKNVSAMLLNNCLSLDNNWYLKPVSCNNSVATVEFYKDKYCGTIYKKEIFTISKCNYGMSFDCYDQSVEKHQNTHDKNMYERFSEGFKFI
jgi:hypothetical protein